MPTECWHMQEGHREAFTSHVKHHHSITIYYHTHFILPEAWQNNQIPWIKTELFSSFNQHSLLHKFKGQCSLYFFYPLPIHDFKPSWLILNSPKPIVFHVNFLPPHKLFKGKKRLEQSRKGAGVSNSGEYKVPTVPPLWLCLAATQYHTTVQPATGFCLSSSLRKHGSLGRVNLSQVWALWRHYSSKLRSRYSDSLRGLPALAVFSAKSFIHCRVFVWSPKISN